MGVEADLLANHGLVAADGRLLFAYGYNEAARDRLIRDLNIRLAVAAENQITAARFVLWAANEIRLYHAPGHLRWEWLFERLRRPSPQSLGRDLVGRGLAWWGRQVRTSESGNRHYLYSLMAEGGLPEAYLAQAPAYRGALLAMMAEIEAEGSLAGAAAERIAWRRAGGLPQTFRHQDTILLFADLALALAELRTHFPADIPPQAAEGWLDQRLPGWRDRLPIRFTDGVLNELRLAHHPRIQSLRRNMSTKAVSLSEAAQELRGDPQAHSDAQVLLDAAACAIGAEGRLLPWRAHLFHRPFKEESVMQREIAREFDHASGHAYTVDQEAATADEKETDIRLHSTVPDQQAVIELKLGDDRSGADLRDTLQSQLVTKYMAAENCRSGCLLVTVAEDRRWEHPETGESLGVTGLKEMLDIEAATIMSNMAGQLRLSVKVLDLRPRLSTERERRRKGIPKSRRVQ